ncbi:outer membrane beta-barrel protein [Sphingobium limneticum]|uniref:outer membrane beta-barrel protein n=1 Tax=Sphingobium limneticum TaxID=1007511 RepID=UPI00123DB6F3|nr:outer membrane beta-barrel protein [Sphingobium limneticum]KAA9013031.1 outer membrane beta-barrel protein [Sphingobium limneticum]
MISKTMNIGRIATLSLGAMASLVASRALAQEGKRLEFDLGADMLYDSNVARGSEQAAIARGIKPEDVRFSPRVGVTLNQSFGPHAATLVGTAGYDFYSRNERLNRERLKANATGSFRFPICSLDLRSGISRRQSDLGDLAIVPSDPASSSKNIENVVTAGATASCGGSIGLRPSAIVDWSDAQNSASLRQTADNKSITYGGGLLYTHPVIGNITLYAGKREVDYPNRDPLLTTALNSFSASRYGVLFNRDIGSQVKLEGELLYSDVKLGNGRDAFSGTNWRFATTISFTQLQFIAETSRSVDPSLGFDANYVLQSNHSLTVRYALSARLTSSLAGSIAVRDYDYEPAVAVSRIVHDNMKRVSLGLAYQLTSRVSLDATGGYQKRNANGGLYDYSSYQVGMGVSTSF